MTNIKPEQGLSQQEYEGNLDLWEATSPPPDRHSLSVSVTVRLSPAEAGLMREFAKERSMSYSEVVRQAIRSCALGIVESNSRSVNEDYEGLDASDSPPIHNFSGDLFTPSVVTQSGTRRPRLSRPLIAAS